MAVCSLLKFRVSFLRIPVSCRVHLQAGAMSNKKAIPDRWTDYAPVGKRIPGTRFIAFKVPLKQSYDGFLPSRQRFSITHLLKEIEKQNEELGLVVDLTCTDRYYCQEELPMSIKYSKIYTRGQQVPSDEVVTKFKNVVTQYLNRNLKNDKLVGVHCTHGLNRTGYLVCRYLIDELKMEPSEAIEKFNDSRGHTMERSNYVHDLLHAESRNNPELNEPREPFPTKKHFSRPHPYPEEEPRSHGYNYHAPRFGPRFSGPPNARPYFHHKPGQMMGPRHGFQHSGGRFPRAPHGPRHHPQRPFPQSTGYNRVNGAPHQDHRTPFPQSDDSSGDYNSARPPRSQQHDNIDPYRRFPKPGRKSKFKTPKQ